MATVAKTDTVVLCNVPFLFKKISCTGGTTAADIAHGEDRAPDAFWVCTTDSGNPTQTGVGVSIKDADEFTVDCVVDAAETFDIYCIWMTHAAQDGQSINADNNS